MSADYISPAVAIQQELDAAFPPDDPTASGSEAPQPDLRPQPDNPRETEALLNSENLTPHPVFASFAEAMRPLASPEHLSAAHSWLNDLRQLDGPLENVPIQHGYTIRDYGFTPGDLPYVHHFLNRMAEAGASEEFIHQAIIWYLDSQDTSSHATDGVREAIQAERDTEIMDKQDRDAARGKLKEIWSEEYDANIHLANRYLDTLPASQRAFYESPDDTGTLRLNRPEILDRLAQEARATVPPVLREAAREHGSERAALEAMMADRSSAYWKGADAASLQARYRDLISSGDSGEEKPLPKGSGIAQEIAEIEHTMRTNFHKYHRDEAMQARYRQLLELTGG